jgi:hypothetical protein
MIKRDLQNIGDAYGDMLNALKYTIVKESKNGIKPGGNDFNDRGDNFAKQEGGMTKDGGASMALNDDHPSNCKCGCKEEDNEEKLSSSAKKEAKLREALKNPKLSDAQRKNIQDQLNSIEASESEEEKELQESRKMGKQILNTVMTRKTLSFDKLFRSVVNENYMGMEDAEDDVDAFGLEDEMTDDEMGSDMGGDEVTFTLDKATAQKLHDVLMAALGGEEEGDDEGEDLDFDMGDEGEDDMGGDFEEDEETPSIGKLTGKPNKVGKLKASSGKASSDVTDKVGDDGDYGHALYNAKQPNIGAGSNNKVGNYKAGAEYIK